MPEVTLFFDYHYRHVTYRTPCRAIGHLVLFGNILRVLRIWECFLLSGFFALHSFLLVSNASLGAGSSTLMFSRASCWSSKHSPGLTICLNHSNPQTLYTKRFVFKAYHIIKILLVVNILTILFWKV